MDIPRRRMRGVVLIACFTVLGALNSGRPGTAQSSATFAADLPAQPAPCEEAILNPISGYAECVRPPGAPVDPPPPRPPVIKLAVFDFELDDVSPAESILGQTASHEATMEAVSREARRILAASGRYLLVDVDQADALPVREKTLRNCGGCRSKNVSFVCGQVLGNLTLMRQDCRR
jgi:hypothetical protein